jgi:hypothetical protein
MVYLDRPYDGPYEAVTEFLAGRSDFVVDREREYQLVTFNPRGFLSRTGTIVGSTAAVRRRNRGAAVVVTRRGCVGFRRGRSRGS